MIVTSLEDIQQSRDEVDNGDFLSRRMILSKDGMGYSVHETHIPPNQALRMWYKHHLETVFCLDGAGEVEDLGEGQTHRLEPGVLYALNRHDHHVLRSFDDGLRLFCIFNPPLVGDETHQADGSYALLDEAGEVVRD
ncbi:MAG: L-ectoine synthase [Salinisphaeraceae bacterium]|jgi:L-ectoine synthase|nr:L-ectoine synthase [Salinisphaeraceae bacterium]